MGGLFRYGVASVCLVLLLVKLPLATNDKKSVDCESR
jgi:hypothetical protein